MSSNVILEVLKHIRENPGASPKDIAVSLGLDQNLVKRIIYRMKSKGFVEKAGGGYVLTSRGEWFLGKVSGKPVEKKNVAAETQATGGGSVGKVEEKAVEPSDIDVLNRLNEVENKVKKIEAMIESVKRELSSLRDVVEKTIESKRTQLSHKVLPLPVMSIHDAKQSLGPSFDTYRSEGRIVIIGSLAVDREFYENFKKKFPLMISDKDKLSELEQALIEEMIKDARVIISCGKQYKLIE